jgi:ferrochelatase
VAFVSEHSETLVELDIEYRELALKHGVAAYVRVPTVTADAEFIAGLAKLVKYALGNATEQLLSEAGEAICPAGCGRCPHRAGFDYDAVAGPRKRAA